MLLEEAEKLLAQHPECVSALSSLQAGQEEDSESPVSEFMNDSICQAVNESLQNFTAALQKVNEFFPQIQSGICSGVHI